MKSDTEIAVTVAETPAPRAAAETQLAEVRINASQMRREQAQRISTRACPILKRTFSPI